MQVFAFMRPEAERAEIGGVTYLLGGWRHGRFHDCRAIGLDGRHVVSPVYAEDADTEEISIVGFEAERV